MLLLGLTYVWGRNFLQVRSRHTLGLLLFAALLLARNVYALYVYQIDPALAAWFASGAIPGPAWYPVFPLHLLETFALVFLAWATWN